MALIECSECQHRISDKAASCPSCGYAPKQAVATESFKMTTSGTSNSVTILFLVMLGLGWYIWSAINQTGYQSQSHSVANQLNDKHFSIEINGTSGRRFHGSYGCIQSDGKNSQQSVEGTIPSSYSCTGMIASTFFQKETQDSATLTVEIKVNGQTVKSASTEAAFGVAAVATD